MNRYTSLITNYHATKARFVNHVDLSTRPLIDVSATVQGLVDAFCIDDAVGTQLDIVGLWIGLSRIVKEPIEGVYFCWDTDDVGWDQGVWQGMYDPDDGYTSLSDEAYRQILKIRIALNNWDGSNDSLAEILEMATAGSGLSMQIVDNQDMTISVWIFPEHSIDEVSREILAVIRMGYLTVRAAGVYTAGIEIPSEGNRFFGFDLDNEYFGGFDEGAWGTVLS